MAREAESLAAFFAKGEAQPQQPLRPSAHQPANAIKVAWRTESKFLRRDKLDFLKSGKADGRSWDVASYRCFVAP
jgi:hypothetical protein